MPRKQQRKQKVPATVKAYVKREISGSQEVKVFNDPGLSTTADVSGSMAGLVGGIVQGTAEDERVGDTIRVSALKMKGYIALGDSQNRFRLVIFQWHPDTASETPTVAKILTTSSTYALGPNSLPNYFQRSKYKILYDKSVVLHADRPEVPFAVNIYKKRMRPVTFNVGAATGRNTLWYLIISDSSAATHPSISFDYQLHYTDA